MTKVQELYMKQMRGWIEGQKIVTDQLQRTIKHYEDMADSTRKELEQHEKTTSLGIEGYHEWLNENDLGDES